MLFSVNAIAYNRVRSVAVTKKAHNIWFFFTILYRTGQFIVSLATLADMKNPHMMAICAASRSSRF
jgi:hypothetical protein